MQTNQNSNPHVSSVTFINYKPAELRIGLKWIVIFYAKNPLTQKLDRFRVYVPEHSNKSERKKLAQQMVLEINNKLFNGWLPYYSDNYSKEFKTYEFCSLQYLKFLEKEVASGAKRKDSVRSYNSFLNMINNYCEAKNVKLNFLVEMNKTFVVNYLDWIYYDRSNSERTYNNHLNFINTFVSWCISRGYLKENFTTSILRKKNAPKIRQIFTPEIKEKIKLLQNDNFNYYALCMATYFCFLRRTEITKLKISDVNLIENSITIPGEISKNKKTEVVTIPKAYVKILTDQINCNNKNWYLFSSDNFKPGTEILNPKKISDQWNKFRIKNEIPTKFQFYSLKDTGITNLLESGIAAIKVRDQARHHDLKITESYTARNKNCDEVVYNSDFSF
jgi:site-specific recombinase XerD